MPPKIIREAAVGKATVKLAQMPKGFAGSVSLGGARKAYEEGADADEVWRRVHDIAARLNPSFFGYDGARSRFLHFFPGGFGGAGYRKQERDYKDKAKDRLSKAAPLDLARTGSGFGEAALAAFQGTNLLSPFEKTRLGPLLRSPGADEFIQASAAFAEGDAARALAAMKAVLKPHDSAKWTVVTYLPFLWKPNEHFFLKPTMIQAFAERVGHRFADAYKPELDPTVYRALLDLAAETEEKVADLQPRDMIDVQGFMWTAVEYTENDRQPND